MKGIVINPLLIQATMEDRKQRTRRLITVRSSEDYALMMNIMVGIEGAREEFLRTNAPYKKEEVIYVKEEHFIYGKWKKCYNGRTKGGRAKLKFCPGTFIPLFEKPQMSRIVTRKETGYHKRIARFMPERYARTFLEVTDIRMEQLQDITEEEAILEGVTEWEDGTYRNYSRTPGFREEDGVECLLARSSFMTIFDSLHTAGTWESNPYVWVISFKRVKKPTK